MPRGRKKVVDYDAEINALEEEIAKLTDNLKKKKDQLKALKDKKKTSDNAELIKLIEESGKTKEEIAKLLKK